MLTVPSDAHVTENDVRDLLNSVRSSNLRLILRRALRRSEILKRRFRHVAERSFAILKNYKGVETNINRRQLNSETLLRIVEKIPGFPLLEEAYREVMEDHMNVSDAEKVLQWIEEGEVRVTIFRSYDAPSPFAHNIVAQGYSDVVLMEDRKKLLLRLYEAVMRKVRG
jgi:ATP-dependent Lhr-like helicase